MFNWFRKQGWMTQVLIIAGIYNLLWGSWVVFFPTISFAYSGLSRPEVPLDYPQLWQCIGMIVGVYGFGYLAAARNPVRHWPIVMVGFLGKIFGPMGYIWGVLTNQTEISAGLTIVFNDLIWWIPFALILRNAWLYFRDDAEESPAPDLQQAIANTKTSTGQTIAQLSENAPVLLVFLRHFGCTFCREALADIQALEKSHPDAKVVLAHLAKPEEAASYLQLYGLENRPTISDPEAVLYRAFGLKRAKFSQWLNRQSVKRFFEAKKYGVGQQVGDGFRMPGVFLILQGKVIQEYRHELVSDRPDYAAILQCELATS